MTQAYREWRDRAIAAAVHDVHRDEALSILGRFARDRVIRPLKPTRAWEPRAPRVTAAELRASWEQLKAAVGHGNPLVVNAAERVFERDLVAFLEQ